jgi:hypothetical protein
VPIIGDIRRETGLDSVMIGLFTPDSHLHAPDENFEAQDGRARPAERRRELELGLAGADRGWNPLNLPLIARRMSLPSVLRRSDAVSRSVSSNRPSAAAWPRTWPSSSSIRRR